MAEIYLDQTAGYKCNGGVELRFALAVQEPQGKGKKGRVELSSKLLPGRLSGIARFSVQTDAAPGQGVLFDQEVDVKYVKDPKVPVTLHPAEYEAFEADKKALQELYTADVGRAILICIENPGSKKHGTRKEYTLNMVEQKLKKKKSVKKKKRAGTGGADVET
ncbi:hypothetical protein KY310_01295 [Candidatus Woesearchaeota archaeon]|nr:hypothetical protein [Candidatus Woesearchaeota archaeon]